METKKVIEVSLGVGLNQLFPEPIQVVIDQLEENKNELNKNEDGKKSKRTPKKSS